MKAKIVLMCLVLLVVANGCIWMSTDSKIAVTEAAITTNLLNDKCQAGDGVACREGLKGASDTLNQIVADTK